MKTSLRTLNEVLTFQLEGMYDAEKRIQKELPKWTSLLESADAAEIVSRYIENATANRLKLKRIFGYLLTGPFNRRNSPVEHMLAEGSEIARLTGKGNYRDILILSGLEGLHQYKVTCYHTALRIALQIELNKVSEMLEDMIFMEMESGQEMSDFISREVTEIDIALVPS
jgi:ferritin-like metal-binding protein YciE